MSIDWTVLDLLEEPQRQLVTEMVLALARVEGVEAIVLTSPLHTSTYVLP